MTYQEAIRQRQEPPCSIEHCDSIRFPFGRYKGERVKDVVERDTQWASQFAYAWLTTEADPANEYHEDNMALGFSLLFLLGEHEANRVGGELLGSR